MTQHLRTNIFEQKTMGTFLQSYISAYVKPFQFKSWIRTEGVQRNHWPYEQGLIIMDWSIKLNEKSKERKNERNFTF